MIRSLTQNSSLSAAKSINYCRIIINGFKSDISLDKLYPNCKVDYLSSSTKPESDSEKFNGVIPVEKLQIIHSHSSGPGGQNVNKVNTKAQVRFNVQNASWIPEKIKPRLINHYKTKFNKEGCLVISSEKTRSQILNVADCLDKIRHMIWKVSYEPPPPTKEQYEVMIKRREKAVQERLRTKRNQSLSKQGRQAPDIHEI